MVSCKCYSLIVLLRYIICQLTTLWGYNKDSNGPNIERCIGAKGQRRNEKMTGVNVCNLSNDQTEGAEAEGLISSRLVSLWYYTEAEEIKII